MGSHPTLAHHQLANETIELDPNDGSTTTTSEWPSRPASRPSIG
jgi:hypothetical protein